MCPLVFVLSLIFADTCANVENPPRKLGESRPKRRQSMRALSTHKPPLGMLPATDEHALSEIVSLEGSGDSQRSNASSSLMSDLLHDVPILRLTFFISRDAFFRLLSN